MKGKNAAKLTVAKLQDELVDGKDIAHIAVRYENVVVEIKDKSGEKLYLLIEELLPILKDCYFIKKQKQTRTWITDIIRKT